MGLPPITSLRGDCLDLIPTLDRRSIRAVITSPPYALQRKSQYGGIAEEKYPAWMVSVFHAIKPKLTEDGSIIVNIRSHLKDGAVSDYVLKTRLALRDAGFIENEELMWYKHEAPALGSKHRPRRHFENILWFSTCKNPFVNLTAAGRLTTKKGTRGTKKSRENRDVFRGESKVHKTGVSRIPDVFVANVGENAQGVSHTATFPPTLVEQLLQTFSAEGDVILDPFAGSGTTLFVARFMNRRAIGIERKKEYYDLILKRRDTIDWSYDPMIPNLDGWSHSVEHAATLGVKLNKKRVFGFMNEVFALARKERWRVLDV